MHKNNLLSVTGVGLACVTAVCVIVVAGTAVAGQAAAPPASSPKAANAQATTPGVEYSHLVEAGPQSIHVVSFDLHGGNLAVVATVGESVKGNETVSDMVTNLPKACGQPIAAINGDYFEFNSQPRYFGTLQGMCVTEGEMVASPPANAFWIDAKGLPHLTHVDSRLAVIGSKGREIPFSVNCSTRDFKSEVRAADTVLYTPRFGASTQTAKDTREWVLQRPTPAARWLPLAPSGVYTARVSDVLLAGDAPIPRDGLVLSVAKVAKGETFNAAVGDSVRIRMVCDPDMTGVRTAIAGDPVLLAKGKVLPKESVANRAPRTAVGLTGSKVWFVVVDGRQPATAIGMSHYEIAVLMKRLGCTDAINLDGGGSSTLWLEGKVMNQLSGGSARRVGNALVLVKRP